MTIPTCPTCGGEQIGGHPSGLLGWAHANGCLVRAAEDSTAAADHAQVARWGRFTRPMTSAEASLLSVALGYVIAPNAVTRVERWTASITRRTWPDLPAATPPAAMAARPAPAPPARDPFAGLRHLDQTIVTVPITETVDDPDGELPTVTLTTNEPGLLVLPPLPDPEDDE